MTVAERLKRGLRFKHGLARTKEYYAWGNMMKRCYNPSSERYASYGGRGIRVCARWHKFESFLADMGKKPAGRTLDRRDNDGDYEPKNCRWATTVEQVLNKQNSLRRKFYALDGRQLSIYDIARHMAIPPSTLYAKMGHALLR